MKYALIDFNNMYWRARHAVKASDQWTAIGYTIHLVLSIIHRTVQDVNCDHTVICLEDRSWRKDVASFYKRNRSAAKETMTDDEREEDQMMMAAFNDLCEFMNVRTNCTVIRAAGAEADDIIARWIALHPDDHHTIVSSDSDFYQLIADNVYQFNGITEQWIKPDGFYDAKMRPIMDKPKGKASPTVKPQHKKLGNPEYILFEKCMRGDSSDNVFSAYPGVRTKGSKNRVGLLEAFEDKDKQGYNWNNMMLQRWTDHDGNEHLVKDDYERNKLLIDLKAQPDHIKDSIDLSIVEHVLNKPPALTIGAYFMKFCGKYELNRISSSATKYVEWMSKPYEGALKNL